MFYDLNIKINKAVLEKNILQEIIEQLVEYGYEGVALTVEVDDTAFAGKKDKSKKKSDSSESDPIPPPVDISNIKNVYPKLNIYRRVNIALSESENVRKVFQSKHIKKYDLISFQPETQNVLKTLTGIADVDIISYNPESKFSLTLNRKLYNQFVNQNVFFELVYVPAVTSCSARRNLIALSHFYHAVGKSKNVIVSSGTEIPHHVRGPYDVMNFNLLFGLSEEQAKGAISKNCEKLLLKARKQRCGKGMVEVSLMDTGSLKQTQNQDNISESVITKMEE